MGVGGASVSNNLLKLVDFVSEKGYESQGLGNEDSSSKIFEEATRIYQNSISFDIIQVKNFKIFLELLPSVTIFCFFQWQISKNGAFSNNLKDVVMKSFPGQVLRSPFLVAP